MKKTLFVFLAALVVLVLNLIPSISEAAPHKTKDGTWVWDLTASAQGVAASPWKHNFELGAFGAGVGLPGHDAFGLGGLEFGYQPTYKFPNGQRLGIELGGSFGGASDNHLAFGLNVGGVYYPIEHLGLDVGYQFLLLKKVGKEDPGLGHYARFGVQVPITSWFELTGFGLLGWGSYQTSKPQQTTTGDLTVTTTVHDRHTGVSGGGGGGLSFKF